MELTSETILPDAACVSKLSIPSEAIVIYCSLAGSITATMSLIGTAPIGQKYPKLPSILFFFFVLQRMSWCEPAMHIQYYNYAIGMDVMLTKILQHILTGVCSNIINN